MPEAETAAAWQAAAARGRGEARAADVMVTTPPEAARDAEGEVMFSWAEAGAGWQHESRLVDSCQAEADGWELVVWSMLALARAATAAAQVGGSEKWALRVAARLLGPARGACARDRGREGRLASFCAIGHVRGHGYRHSLETRTDVRACTTSDSR